VSDMAGIFIGLGIVVVAWAIREVIIEIRFRAEMRREDAAFVERLKRLGDR
jgi:hypothetical protein